MPIPLFKHPRNGDPSTRISDFIFILFLLAVLYLFYLILRPFLTDLFVASITAMIFYPLYQKILRGFRGRKILAGLLSLLVIILAFLIPLSLLSGVITTQSFELYGKISQGLQDGSIRKAIELKLVYFNLFFDRLPQAFRNYSEG